MKKVMIIILAILLLNTALSCVISKLSVVSVGLYTALCSESPTHIMWTVGIDIMA